MLSMEKEQEPVVEQSIAGKGMSFNYFLATIQGGDLHAELTTQLHDLGAALSQSLQDYGGIPKGEINLKLKFRLEKGVVHVLADRSMKLPKVPEAGTLLFIDSANNFVQDNPRQMNMGFPRSGPRPVP
jgi:hypothetical protein